MDGGTVHGRRLAVEASLDVVWHEITRTAKQTLQGGTMIVNALKSVLETGRPGFGVRTLFVRFRLLQPLSPKRCRSEDWPVAP